METKGMRVKLTDKELLDELIFALKFSSYKEIDDLIMKFRSKKTKDLETLITWLTYTQPIKNKLKYRKGLYKFTELYHGKEILKGLE